MNILHKLSEDDIEAVVGAKMLRAIECARTGKCIFNLVVVEFMGKLTVG